MLFIIYIYYSVYLEPCGRCPLPFCSICNECWMVYVNVVVHSPIRYAMLIRVRLHNIAVEAIGRKLPFRMNERKRRIGGCNISSSKNIRFSEIIIAAKNLFFIRWHLTWISICWRSSYRSRWKIISILQILQYAQPKFYIASHLSYRWSKPRKTVYINFII